MSTHRQRRLLLRSLGAVLCFGAACTADTEDSSPDNVSETTVTQTTTDGVAAPDRPSSTVISSAELLEGGQRLEGDLDGPTAGLTTLQEDPLIAAAVYPRPDYEGNPWSQWGQGVVLPDGRVFSGIGDHLGVDGNSFVFVYDPEDGTITRIADVLSALPHEAGSWGYGKIHGQMVMPGDGGIWFTTYYGTRRGLTFDGSYRGDVLFRLDTTTLELRPVTVPAERRGVPSLASDGAGLIFGETVDPLLEGDNYPGGGFFVFDVRTGSVEFSEETDDREGFRNIIVPSPGVALFGREGGGLYEFTDDTASVSEIDLNDKLRASATTASGAVYGVTDEPYNLFAIDPEGELSDLGTASGYTTSVALTPDDSQLLYIPGAHGSSWVEGTPLLAVDVQTGEQTTVALLDELVRAEFDLVLGGTYNITVDADRNQAIIGFNAGRTEDDPWGEVVLVVVELP